MFANESILIVGTLAGDQEHAEGLKEDEYDFTLDDCIHGSNRNGPQSRGGRLFWKDPERTMLFPSHNSLF